MSTIGLALSITGGVACVVAAGGMAVRAHWLGSRVSGWPSAPAPLRWVLWTAAGVLGAQGFYILRWTDVVERGECAVYVATAVLSVVYAVNLLRQRSAAHVEPIARPHGLKLVPSRKRH